MTSRRLSPLLAGLGAAAVTAAVSLTTPAAAVAPRTLYANPHGEDTSCNKINPCDIGTAFGSVAAGDTILLAPGTYQAGTTTLAESAAGVLVTGTAGSAAPVIDSAANVGINIDAASSLADVTLAYTGGHTGLILANAGATADHVTVKGNGNTCVVFGSLTDSLCTTTTKNSAAIQGVSTNHTYSPVLLNDTAWATATVSYGLLFEAEDNQAFRVKATNVIAHGGAADVEASTNSGTGSATITLSHSDYATAIATGDASGVAEVIGGGGNISKAPKFVDAATGNFEEAKASVTIDAGTASAASGATDLAGVPRIVGGTIDIGAYEYTFAPTVGKVTASKLTANTVELSVPVTPNGLATKVRFVATAGKKKVHTAYATVAVGATSVKVKIELKKLTTKTKYVVVAHAKNAAGSTASKHLKLTTT